MSLQHRFSRTKPLVGLCLALGLGACGEDVDPGSGSGDYLDHGESSDFESVDALGRSGSAGPDHLGSPPYFNKNFVVSDEFFAASDSVTGDAIQAFLEHSPYGGASWIAQASVSGHRAADAILEASLKENLNPIVMLARMQVEESLISRSTRPSQSVVDFAFGCGCPDRRGCDSKYRGLDKQIECAADTLNGSFGRSVDGSGGWRVGVSRRAGDRVNVVPANHATAAFYAYTPWVLERRGGNWLVWNVTRKFTSHFANRGTLDYPSTRTEGGVQRAELIALGLDWSRDGNAWYTFRAFAPHDVDHVEYWVDGKRIAKASREESEEFQAQYTFLSATQVRSVEARGLDSSGRRVALGIGLLEDTPRTAVYVRQRGEEQYEVGLERPTPGIGAIEIKINGELVTDEISGTARSERLAVAITMKEAGPREFTIDSFNEDGSAAGRVTRRFLVR